jgi:hypothetical protein
MNTFKAAFEIINARNCPLYNLDDCFLLTDKAVELPLGRPSCLLLVRDLTGLLFSLLPHAGTNFAEQRNTVFTCGGCTGLIKFKLTDKPLVSNANIDSARIQEKSESVVSGK